MFAAVRKADYQGNRLTYDLQKSRKVSMPIYHDVDGKLYMPLNERFVTVEEVVSVLAAHQNQFAKAF